MLDGTQRSVSVKAGKLFYALCAFENKNPGVEVLKIEVILFGE